ncbi:hypothetical protein FrCorBMG51_16195 [Protofrankia coriariae]|uniref:Uncharacterized protein n=1 Tax=Protofrankia coriariae TaxID=1562887 RepID=A0ABR5F1Y4_9ACTN|nr:hypothetical protein FrCorBMG51_16195 [Protofrankia coriariae]
MSSVPLAPTWEPRKITIGVTATAVPASARGRRPGRPWPPSRSQVAAASSTAEMSAEPNRANT